VNFRYLPFARQDVIDLANFYNARAHGLGGRFVLDLADYVTLLLAAPRIGTRVTRPPRGREVRYGFTRRFRAVVHYEVAATEVVILSVQHHRSNRRPWRRRLNTP